ncbi:MAG TPA: methylenetetrahydrofolate reductase [NAD(P)H] [Dermatophilaceae bacterium]|nr:methylenetetrahydrofolate reductase [NAD(P)H] [Dermatophilaceae bacterium]
MAPGSLARPAHLTRSIPEMLASDHPSVSFEFFPPKDDESEAVLWAAIRRLEQVRPDFVSVTYGAGGTTQDRTVRVTERIARETTLTPLAHLTCVGASVASLRQVVGAYAAAGVRSILALRGDPPGDARGTWTPHPEGLDHAEDLVRLVARLGDFAIGVAAFPDVHPDSPDLDHDVEVLVRKAEAGATFAITQMVFDAESYLRLRDRVAARCALPVTPGLMPVTNLRQITRMAQLMGTPLPAPVVSRLEAVADDPAAVRAVGVEIATEVAGRMLDEGAPGIHFITMNRSTAALEVHENLDLGPVRQATSIG